jgi:hypothetical protein
VVVLVINKILLLEEIFNANEAILEKIGFAHQVRMILQFTFRFKFVLFTLFFLVCGVARSLCGDGKFLIRFCGVGRGHGLARGRGSGTHNNVSIIRG